MNKPTSPQNKPYSFSVEAGKEYHICMCGKSFKQPLCDGNHAVCGCKYTVDKTGKCDGTHSSL